VCKRCGAARRERRHRLAALRIDRKETLPAGNEDPGVAPFTAPVGDAAAVQPGAAQRRALFVGSRIEQPELLAGIGIERDDLVKRRARIQHVVDHDRRRFEPAGPHVVLGHWLVGGLPGPRQFEAAGVFGGDVGGR
jgi:hypothetical protein